jgi:hypothetical protein
MPDFQPTSEVTHLTSPSDQTSFTTNYDLDFPLQNTVPAPRARTVVYNAVYPISALGFKSPTLAQLMARYATMDPILFSATADKRKGLSLIEPPAAKRKRTTKKVPVEVRFPPFFIYHKITLILTNFTLCNFRLEPSSLQLQYLPMLHPLV